MDRVSQAAAALRLGKPVLLFDADDREGETDIVYASEHVTPEAIRHLRTDAGGLLCTTVSPEHHGKLGLPFAADLLREAAGRHPVLHHMQANDLRYDRSKSSFGLTVNSRRTFTGIPDGDRALTVTELATFLRDVEAKADGAAQAAFGAQFRAPGHVVLLNAAQGGLAARRGHTELATELLRQAGLVPSATICEMLANGDREGAGGLALPKKAAEAYAQRHGLVFLTGQDVVLAWQARMQQSNPIPVPMSAS